MQCTRPYRVESEKLSVPCGKCLACRIAKAREWSVRLLHELGYHDKAAFVTLTYDDDHVPSDGSLNKREIVLFLKRLRKAKEPERLKYYLSGEYGDINGRPHYHAIIFGIDSKEDDTETVRIAWGKGFVYLGTVTYDSCRYVADYIMKKYNGKKAKDVYGDKQVPFSKISKAIGEAYCLEQSEHIKRGMGITVRGVQVGIPRYYKKKLDLDPSIFVEQARKRFELRHEYFANRVDEACIGEEIAKNKAQAEKNLEARANLYKKGII